MADTTTSTDCTSLEYATGFGWGFSCICSTCCSILFIILLIMLINGGM